MNQGASDERLRVLYETGQWDRLADALRTADYHDVLRFVLRLDADERLQLMERLPLQLASHLLEQLPEHVAAELLTDLPLDLAADLLDELPHDRQADLLARVAGQREEELLAAMSPEDAEEAGKLVSFAPDTAGGLMITEFLAYRDTACVDDVLEDLRRHADEYARYDVQYVYVVDRSGRLIGVLRLRDLLLAPGSLPIRDIMIDRPDYVHTWTPLQELVELARSRPFFGFPVVDDHGRLVGVVRRADIEEAAEAEAGRTLLRFFGIAGGEELRTDPLSRRLAGRSVWLSANLLLDLAAASVIALYEEVLASFIALAVFLPIISDMGGNSGSQSLAVTIREMALGLVGERDVRFVWVRELPLGILAGGILGCFGFAIAWLWQGHVDLAFVFGIALFANTLWAVMVGAVLPLVMVRFGVDPALAANPVLTTLTDIFGFFICLECARWLLVA